MHGVYPCTRTYTSKLTGALRCSKTSMTASLTSGPIPSPGIMVTVWGLASPGEGTYVIFVLVCMSKGRSSASEREAFLALTKCSGELLLTAFLCYSDPRNFEDSILIYKTYVKGSRCFYKSHLLGLQQRPRKP